MALEAREDMSLTRFYLVAIFHDVIMTGFMSVIDNHLTASPACRREFLVVFPQALGHATAPRFVVGTELHDILATGSIIRGGDGSLHNQSAGDNHRQTQ